MFLINNRFFDVHLNPSIGNTTHFIKLKTAVEFFSTVIAFVF